MGFRKLLTSRPRPPTGDQEDTRNAGGPDSSSTPAELGPGGQPVSLLIAAMCSTSAVERAAAIRLVGSVCSRPEEAVAVFRQALSGGGVSPNATRTGGWEEGGGGGCWSDEDKVAAACTVADLIKREDALLPVVLAFVLELHDSTRDPRARIVFGNAVAASFENFCGAKIAAGRLGSALHNWGDHLYEQQRYGDAIVGYGAALLFAPTRSETYFNRALARYQIADYVRALRDYDQCAILDPANPMIWNNRGDAYYKKGEYSAALVDYNEAIRLNPGYLKAHYNAGLAHASKDEFRHAIEAFTKAIELKPSFAEAFHLRGLAYEHDGQPSAAIADYQQALQLNPGVKEAAQHLEALEKKTRSSSDDDCVAIERMLERPTTTFADVVGMDTVKAEVSLTLVEPLANPKLARQYGIPVTGGILLYGPPGCGKTMTARAAAGEAKAAFYYIDLAAVLNKYVGESESNLRRLFEHAVRHAPAIIFIDEIDGLAASRDSDGPHQAWERKTVNQLLMEMSRLEGMSNPVPLLVIGATNQPWLVDQALRRAGRIGTDIYVPGPDRASRRALFAHLLRDKPTADLDFDVLADLAGDDRSNALIKNICERAARPAWRQARQTNVTHPITMAHLRDAIAATEPDLRSWLKAARKHDLPMSRVEARMGF